MAIAVALAAPVADANPAPVAEAIAEPVAAPAPVAEPAVLEKRNTIQFNTYGPSNCNSSPNTRFAGASGGCQNFNAVSFGAQYENLGGGTCVFKSWENRNCNGKATTRTITSGANTCYMIANKNDGTFCLTNGAQSVSVTCA